MAAVRILTAGVLSACAAGLTAGPAAAGPPPKAAVPRWVRDSVRSAGGVKGAAAEVRGLIDQAAGGAPAGRLALSGVRAASAATALYLDNRRLFRAGKASPRLQAVGRLLRAADGAIMLYGLMDDGSPDNAARGAVQSAVAYGASAATTAGMLWVASAFGTASTGTAIGSLSGAAYTSAATAWWGGGAAAAGGGGMAVGTAVMTGGTVVVAVAAGYAVDKAIDYFDPAERDGLNLLVAGVLRRPDLTDPATPHGAALREAARRLDAAERALGR